MFILLPSSQYMSDSRKNLPEHKKVAESSLLHVQCTYQIPNF